MEITSYKCPCCSAVITFDIDRQKMSCASCGNTFEMEAVKDFNEAQLKAEESSYEWNNVPSEEWQEDNMDVYICPSCGGQIVADGTLASTRCPYCDSIAIIKEKLSGVLKPDLVIPFKFDKNAAVASLKNFYKNKFFLPKVFKSQNKIESIQGVYVPFWLFDCDTNADITYNATRTTHWSDSKYNYTKTSHFLLMRQGSLGFAGLPVDGSSKMPNDITESIEPFDLSQAVPFDTAYLSGYLADKYDIDADLSKARANQRVENSVLSTFGSTTAGYCATPSKKIINITDGSVKYALLPVWMLSTKFKDKNYIFAMNGQTGKFVGNLPVDWTKFWLCFAGIAGITFAVLWLIFAFLG